MRHRRASQQSPPGSFLNWRLAACKRSTVVGTKPPSGGFVVFGVSCEPFAAADLSVGRISLRAAVFSRGDLHHIDTSGITNHSRSGTAAPARQLRRRLAPILARPRLGVAAGRAAVDLEM